MFGDARSSPLQKMVLLVSQILLRCWDVSASCLDDRLSLSKLLSSDGWSDVKKFLLNNFRDIRENGTRGEKWLVSNYLSTAVLGFVAMTASSPTPERTVHWKDLKNNVVIFPAATLVPTINYRSRAY